MFVNVLGFCQGWREICGGVFTHPPAWKVGRLADLLIRPAESAGMSETGIWGRISVRIDRRTSIDGNILSLEFHDKSFRNLNFVHIPEIRVGTVPLFWVAGLSELFLLTIFVTASPFAWFPSSVVPKQWTFGCGFNCSKGVQPSRQQCPSNSRFSGSRHIWGLSLMSLLSRSVSLWIRAARFTDHFLSLQPSQFAARIMTHWRTVAPNTSSKQCLFKNALLPKASIEVSRCFLSKGSDWDPENLSTWSNGMSCAPGLVRSAKLGFVCMPLDWLAPPRETMMRNGPWSVFQICSGIHLPNQIAMPKIDETNVLPDNLVVARMFSPTTTSPPLTGEQFCLATDFRHSSFLHVIDFAAFF